MPDDLAVEPDVDLLRLLDQQRQMERPRPAVVRDQSRLARDVAVQLDARHLRKHLRRLLELPQRQALLTQSLLFHTTARLPGQLDEEPAQALLAGIAGLLLSGLTNTASVSLADSSVLPSVAAVVIGGTSILGGRGGYGGSIVGALILSVLAALLTVLGLPEPTRQIVFGSIIVIVAAAYTRVTAER